MPGLRVMIVGRPLVTGLMRCATGWSRRVTVTRRRMTAIAGSQDHDEGGQPDVPDDGS
jgi:hypothetical protein